MPPVRDASTKPSAATVLPAPVACSNQKRRAAPGSSAMASAAASSSASSAGSQSSGSSSVSSSPSISTSPEWQLLGGGAGRRCRRPAAVAAEQQLGGERDQRARERVDLVGRQGRAVRQVRLVLGEQPLEPEHQRVVAPPLDRRLVAAGVDLGEGGVQRARRAVPGGERRPGVLAVEHEGSRANSSARFRSSPETGEASPTERAVSHVGRSLDKGGRAELSPRRRGPRGQRGPPVVTRRSRTSRAASRAKSLGTSAYAYYSTRTAGLICHPCAMRGSRVAVPSPRALGGCSSTPGAPSPAGLRRAEAAPRRLAGLDGAVPASCSTAAASAFEKRIAAAKGIRSW